MIGAAMCAGKQESLDGSFWTSHSSLQTPRMSNSTEEYVGQGSQQSSQIPQAVPSHLSAVPENWDQQLGQLGSEFGDEFDQPREPSMPPVVQRQQLKRPSDFQLFDALHADIAGPLAKRPRPSPAPARAPAAAPPHLLEEDASPLLHPPLPGSAAPAASAARPARQISPKAVSFAPDVSSIIPALDPAKVVALHHPPPPSAALDAIGRQKRRRHLPDTQVPPSPPSDPAAQGSPAARQDQAEGDGMASYGPAFLQSAISAFDEGRVSVNAKILKKLVPSMDPAEAYVGLGWAGWCLIHNTTPETQLQVIQRYAQTVARPGLQAMLCLCCLTICLLKHISATTRNRYQVTKRSLRNRHADCDLLSILRRQSRCSIISETSSRAWPAQAKAPEVFRLQIAHRGPCASRAGSRCFLTAGACRIYLLRRSATLQRTAPPAKALKAAQ